MTDAHVRLRAAVERWGPLTEASWAAFGALFRPRALRAREPLAHPDDRAPRDVLFVARGLLRFYYAGPGGTESTKAFVGEDDVAGPLAAMALGQTLDYGIEALEPTLVLAAPAGHFAALAAADPAVERIADKLTARLLAHKEIRMRSLMLEDATARYLALLDAAPALAQRVPQRHLASYLGMTDVHLSRVRRALAGARPRRSEPG